MSSSEYRRGILNNSLRSNPGTRETRPPISGVVGRGPSKPKIGTSSTKNRPPKPKKGPSDLSGRTQKLHTGPSKKEMEVAQKEEEKPFYAGKLETYKMIMETVYGRCKDIATWKPQAYAEGKGRYLWTDAFGVCNYVTLFYETGDPLFLQQAEVLVEEVHNVLGRDREGKARLGSATDSEPLKGGLRIGKPGEEHEDGQYFHYLTKWMFALATLSTATANPRYNELAIQLARSTFPHFVRVNVQSGSKRLVWKVSIDMKCTLVPSEGNLDPFDGYITFRILRAMARSRDVLADEIATLEAMVQKKYPRYGSSDPLDLGEALWLAHFTADREPWSAHVGATSAWALGCLWERHYFQALLSHRLAFRELGATLGVQVHPLTRNSWARRGTRRGQGGEGVADGFWYGMLYERDRDITPVMFCASLLPGVWQVDYPKCDRRALFESAL
eukprot:jgi/Mesen1/10408/ME000081S09793